jgi:hypothetical protein
MSPVDPTSRLARAARWLLVALLAVLTWRFAQLPLDGSGDPGYLHLPNLVFHEAGHLIFLPLGSFMNVLGGSLMQLLVPAIFAVAFLRQDNMFAAAVCTWWLGQNFVDLAPYIADARRLQLVLLGGFTGAEVEGHDWEYLLTALGWLHYDLALGWAALFAGIVVMSGATVWAGLTVAERTRDA